MIMRYKIYYLILSVLAFFVMAGTGAYAQSEWTRYEYNSTDHKNHTINLSGNVYITKPIVIKSGAKVTIKNTTGNTLKISNGKDGVDAYSTTYMFLVESGATLKIMGDNDNSKIILDGGAGDAFATWSDAAIGGGIDPDKAVRKLRTCVLSHGTFSMDYACIQNVCGTNSDPSGTTDTGGAISVNGTSCGPTIIDHSIIRYCVSTAGSAILFADQKGGSLDPEDDCKITIRNTTIHYCHSRGGEGGIIRTFGTAVSNLHLYNNIIEKNRAKSGAGLYWNAHGHDNTKCTIDKCIFRNNYATDTGGAMMLETSFEFTGGVTEVYGNYAGSHGGGIGITGYNGGLISGGNMDMRINDRLKITNNTSEYGGGLSFYFGGMSYTKTTNINVIIDGCEISDNQSTKNGGAISFRNFPENYSSKPISVKITMNKGTFEDNTAVERGGGLYVLNTDISYTDTPSSADPQINMKRNKVTGSGVGFGGAIYLEKGSLELGPALMENNTATIDGGALYISGGLLTLKHTSTIQDNSTGRNGGGVWVDGGSKSNVGVSVKQLARLKRNKADNGKGGGVFIYQGQLVVAENKSIVLESNSAQNGGGAYIQGTMNVKGTSTVNDNVASQEAGGLYINGGDLKVANSIVLSGNYARSRGGGIVVNSGNIDFSSANIYNNRAGYDTSNTIVNTNANGGAICVTQGSITIGEGNIHDNYSARYGGAIYASNENDADFTTAAKNISLVGSGVFQKNNASYGGGLYVSGNINMTFAGSVINNNAVNGGGVFLSNGAKLTITGGIIKQNTAKGLPGEPRPTTGYQASSLTIHGIGGGVYLNSGKDESHPTNLVFALTGTTIGLYDNDADWGADAIFANGKNTTVTIPNINQMTFTNFSTPADSPLFWAEDYIKDDPNYDKGTKENKNWDSNKTNERHDFAIRNSMPAYHISFEESEETKTLTSYLSLDVGYELIFVTLVKKGLYPGENAVFTFTPATKKVSDTEYEVVSGTKPYQTVLFKCTKSNQTTEGVVKRLAIPYGWWKIEEGTWSWTYDPDNGSKYDKPLLIDKDHNEFEFGNVRRSDVPTTSEAIVTNRMVSTVTVISEE